LPEKPVKINLHAGFFNKTLVFSNPEHTGRTKGGKINM
jgi:hypothetical protein